MAVKKMTKRDRESAEKKMHIYRTAVGLFKEYGYEGTTMADICEASGMSKGSIYHFFSKKIDLLYHFFAELNQYTLDNLEVSEENLKQPGVAILNYCVGLSNAYEQIGYDMSIQLQNVFEEYATQEKHREASFVHKVSGFIQAAQERGTMQGGASAVEMAHQIHVASVGLYRKWIIDGGNYSLTEANRWFIPVVLNLFAGEGCQVAQGPCPEWMIQNK